MTFKIWNKKTNRVVDRSIIRPAEGPNINIRANGGDPIRPSEGNKEEPPDIVSKKFPNEEPECGEPDYIEEAIPCPSWENLVSKEKGDEGENRDLSFFATARPRGNIFCGCHSDLF